MNPLILTLALMSGVPQTLPECKQQLGRAIKIHRYDLDIQQARLDEARSMLHTRTPTVTISLLPPPAAPQPPEESISPWVVAGIGGGALVVGAVIGFVVGALVSGQADITP